MKTIPPLSRKWLFYNHFSLKCLHKRVLDVLFHTCSGLYLMSLRQSSLLTLSFVNFRVPEMVVHDMRAGERRGEEGRMRDAPRGFLTDSSRGIIPPKWVLSDFSSSYILMTLSPLKISLWKVGWVCGKCPGWIRKPILERWTWTKRNTLYVACEIFHATMHPQFLHKKPHNQFIICSDIKGVGGTSRVRSSWCLKLISVMVSRGGWG